MHLSAILKLKALLVPLVAVAAVAVLSAAVLADGAYNVYFGRTSRLLPIYSVAREDKRISITFDCAWGTDYTEAILSALEGRGVKATFFTVQFWAENNASFLGKIAAAGHEVGSHSKTHSRMSELSEEEISAELESSCAVIERITGKPVGLFRAPFGDYDDLVISTVSKQGLYTIQWDVDSLDWKNLSAAEIFSRVTSRVQSGSIILMHNNGLHTAEAVPLILDSLIARGYEFVTVGELIYKTNYSIDCNGRQHLLEQ